MWYSHALVALALFAAVEASELEGRVRRPRGHKHHKSHHKHHSKTKGLQEAAKVSKLASIAKLSSGKSGVKPAASSASDSNTSDSNYGSGMKISTSFTGRDFLDTSQWAYFTDADPTHGIVTYVSETEAASNKLAYVNAKGNFVMQVDDTSSLQPNQGRNSVRITSSKTLAQGQLLVLDAAHMPTGCSTWPAFWLCGPNWPNGGEVDIVEGVSSSQHNQCTLHTSQGCTLDTPMKASGSVVGTDCYAYANGNSGCGVQDNSTLSWGTQFNNNGGGVFATYWDQAGDWSIWFFPRNSIPRSLAAQRPDVTTFGEPSAYWSSSTCSASFFSDLQIVINTALCGDWAGAVYGQGDGCPGTCSSAVQDPSTFKQAYWEIKSVIIYQ